MYRYLLIAAAAVLGLFALSLIFFYPLGRALGGALSLGETGRTIAAYPRELHAEAAPREAGYLTYADIPPCLVQAVVSVEDKRFFSHSGVDPFALMRVFFEDFANDHRDHGGSTISQQLARIILKVPRQQPRLLPRWRSEFAVMQGALVLEHDYTKDEILEYYLNSVYFGRGATGAASAAQAYFAEPLGSLTQGQCIYLAGLPQAPTVFGEDPWGSVAQARYRHVIGTMERNGYLTASEAAQLRGEALFASSTDAKP